MTKLPHFRTFILNRLFASLSAQTAVPPFATLSSFCICAILNTIPIYFILTLSSSDPHRHAAPDHLALSAVLCASGGETAAPADEGGGLRHTHGGQVAPGHVQEGLPAHTPGL